MTDAARLVPYAEISIINILFTRGNEEGTKRERRGNEEGTKRERRGNEEGTKRERRGNEEGYFMERGGSLMLLLYERICEENWSQCIHRMQFILWT